MIADTLAVEAISTLDHDEWMDLATAEFDRVLALVDSLADADFACLTDCTGWDVKAVLCHMLGMLELQADPDDRVRQISTAAQTVELTGGLRLDALTALQVHEHSQLTISELKAALHDAAPRGLAARRAMPVEMRAMPYDPELPGERPWTLGYLFDTIHTRDPWLHRIDICRATGHTPELTANHDGRIVADVVRDWATHDGKGFTLTLTGPAGGAFTAGDGGVVLELDAVEFCRTLSGRSEGTGLLSNRVVF
jgi:uncharacterized protein (TIGR03083 family)